MNWLTRLLHLLTAPLSKRGKPAWLTRKTHETPPSTGNI